MRKNINTERIEGRIYQHDLTVKKVQNQNSDNFGKDYISGTIDVAVDEECTNIIQIHFTFVTEFTKSGGKSQTYAELKKIIDNGKTWIADGKDEATKVRHDTALALNDFYTQNGTQVSLKINEGGFVTIVNELAEESERNKFTTDMVITNIKRVEADEDKGIKEDYVSVRGAVFNFRNDVLPVEFVVRNDEVGMKYFESLEATDSEPIYTKVWGRIDWSPEIGTYVEESAFGEAVVHTSQKKKREWIITGAAKVAYDFGEENVMTRDELKQAIQNRQVYLTDIKKRRDEYNAQKDAMKNTPSAFNVATAGVAASKGDFNF